MRARIALIGGSSSVGKSTTAKALAARDGWSVVAIDEILRHEPAFNPLSEQLDPWGRSAETLCDLLVAAARAASPRLEREVESVLATGGGNILEGERLDPALVATMMQGGLAAGVFIVEEDAEQLYRTLLHRSGRFAALPEVTRRNVAEVDRLYGRWCLEECERLAVPVVESRPWGSLVDRVGAALDA